MKKTIAQQLNIKEFPFRIKDKQGNKIYFEHSTGFWYKFERDEQGNEIYFEHSNGDWYKYKRDKNGKVIYQEDSNGDWFKYKRNEKGSVIYCEDSTGTIRDNRIKEMTISEIEKALNIKNLKIVK